MHFRPVLTPESTRILWKMAQPTPLKLAWRLRARGGNITTIVLVFSTTTRPPAKTGVKRMATGECGLFNKYKNSIAIVTVRAWHKPEIEGKHHPWGRIFESLNKCSFGSNLNLFLEPLGVSMMTVSVGFLASSLFRFHS